MIVHPIGSDPNKLAEICPAAFAAWERRTHPRVREAASIRFLVWHSGTIGCELTMPGVKVPHGSWTVPGDRPWTLFWNRFLGEWVVSQRLSVLWSYSRVVDLHESARRAISVRVVEEIDGAWVARDLVDRPPIVAVHVDVHRIPGDTFREGWNVHQPNQQQVPRQRSVNGFFQGLAAEEVARRKP